MSHIRSYKQIVTPTTGQTVSINDADGDIRFIINPASSLLALTVNMPSNPRDGQVVNICSSQVVTSLTLSSVNTILGALTTFASVNSYGYWVYDLSTTSWYKLN